MVAQKVWPWSFDFEVEREREFWKKKKLTEIGRRRF